MISPEFELALIAIADAGDRVTKASVTALRSRSDADLALKAEMIAREAGSLDTAIQNLQDLINGS